MADTQVVNAPDVVQALAEVNQTVRQLSRQVTEGAERTVQEVHLVAESAAKTELSKQRAEVEVIGPLLQRQEKALDTVQQRSEERMQAIEVKFDKIAVELLQSYIRDLRRLGRHIFEILEDEYQKGMEDLVLGADFDVFTSLTGKVYERRMGHLYSALDALKEATKRFTYKRRQFKETLRNVKIEAKTDSDREFAVPFWVVETRDEGGRTALRVVGLSRVDRTAVGDCRFQFGPVTEYGQIAQFVQAHLDEVAGRLPWRTASPGDKDALAQEVDALGLGAISGDLKRLLVRQIREQPLSVA